MKVTIYDADPMLVKYMNQAFSQHIIVKAQDADAIIICTRNPDRFSNCMQFLNTLNGSSIQHIVFISDVDVYGRKDGENHDETTHTWATTTEGKDRARMEDFIMDWSKQKRATCTILRPVTMFGSHMGGWPMEMLNGVMRGHYVLVRDYDATKSLVLAYDVARSAEALMTIGGIYNLTDGHPHSLKEIAQAMLDNTGSHKRPFILPYKWAKLLSKICNLVPASIRNSLPGLNPWLTKEEFLFRTTPLTYSSKKISDFTPFQFLDVIKVLRREEKDFPYNDE